MLYHQPYVGESSEADGNIAGLGFRGLGFRV